MPFDATFARDILIPLTNTAYQLSRGQQLVLPDGWTQTGTVTVNLSAVNQETASGLAKTVISENCDWGVVARKGSISVIAIRGTETEEQWLEDFTAIAQPVPHQMWWMHRGFDDVWNSLSVSLQQAWNTACLDNAQVYVTGHSLGAAIALIMGVHHPEAPTWTFAGPSVFSPIHGLPPSANVIRVVNPKDLVPKVPLPPLYQQIGAEVLIAGAADQFDFALQHGLNTYSAGLTALIGH
jgi:hypothetical protein